MGLATPTIKVLVLDLDGTFLRTDKTISRRNREVVRRCAETGIRVIVATARPPRAVRKFLPDMPWVDCVVYYNGALSPSPYSCTKSMTIGSRNPDSRLQPRRIWDWPR